VRFGRSVQHAPHYFVAHALRFFVTSLFIWLRHFDTLTLNAVSQPARTSVGILANIHTTKADTLLARFCNFANPLASKTRTNGAKPVEKSRKS
jgi:hypothetical protein